MDLQANASCESESRQGLMLCCTQWLRARARGLVARQKKKGSREQRSGGGSRKLQPAVTKQFVYPPCYPILEHLLPSAPKGD